MRPAGLELVLPASQDGAALVALLADRLEVAVGRARRLDRMLLDTFDGRLRAAGLSAERSAGRTVSRTLTLREPGAPARAAEVAPAPRLLAAELPAGALRDRLGPVLGVRPLLPLVRMRSRTRSLAVLNQDAKTVVRLELEQAEVVGNASGRAALAPRLWVRPVLGYDKAFERVRRELTGELGFAAGPLSLFDEAATLAGVQPAGVSARPRIELARGTTVHEAARLEGEHVRQSLEQLGLYGTVLEAAEYVLQALERRHHRLDHRAREQAAEELEQVAQLLAPLAQVVERLRRAVVVDPAAVANNPPVHRADAVPRHRLDGQPGARLLFRGIRPGGPAASARHSFRASAKRRPRRPRRSVRNVSLRRRNSKRVAGRGRRRAAREAPPSAHPTRAAARRDRGPAR